MEILQTSSPHSLTHSLLRSTSPLIFPPFLEHGPNSQKPVSRLPPPQTTFDLWFAWLTCFVDGGEGGKKEKRMRKWIQELWFLSDRRSLRNAHRWEMVVHQQTVITSGQAACNMPSLPAFFCDYGNVLHSLKPLWLIIVLQMQLLSRYWNAWRMQSKLRIYITNQKKWMHQLKVQKCWNLMLSTSVRIDVISIFNYSRQLLDHSKKCQATSVQCNTPPSSYFKHCVWHCYFNFVNYKPSNWLSCTGISQPWIIE